VRSKINLKVAAALAGISYNKMLQLNPGFNRAAAKGPYKIVLPIENVEQFSENLIRSPYHESSTPSWTHYRMKAGDTLASVSRKFKIPVEEIRRFNHIAKANPRRGTNLLIPDDGSKISTVASAPSISAIRFDDPPPKRKLKTNSNTIASRVNKKLIEAEIRSTKTYNLQPGDTVYMVRSTDTLEKIAHRFQISPEALRTANRLKGQVSPGKHLVIPTHRVATNLARNDSRAEAKKAPFSSNTTYQVRRGDTIAKIAKRFHTSPASIRLANLIDDSSLLEGVNLVIPSPVRS
jgi:membrane-bound lytic murein transglycosylase D